MRCIHNEDPIRSERVKNWMLYHNDDDDDKDTPFPVSTLPYYYLLFVFVLVLVLKLLVLLLVLIINTKQMIIITCRVHRIFSSLFTCHSDFVLLLLVLLPPSTVLILFVVVFFSVQPYLSIRFFIVSYGIFFSLSFRVVLRSMMFLYVRLSNVSYRIFSSLFTCR